MYSDKNSQFFANISKLRQKQKKMQRVKVDPIKVTPIIHENIYT